MQLRRMLVGLSVLALAVLAALPVQASDELPDWLAAVTPSVSACAAGAAAEAVTPVDFDGPSSAGHAEPESSCSLICCTSVAQCQVACDEMAVACTGPSYCKRCVLL